MEKMLNVILIMGLLVLLNLCLQKHKNEKIIPKNNNPLINLYNRIFL